MLDSLSSIFSGFGIILMIAIPLLLLIALPFLYRVVVPTNTVHIVQSGKKTTSYGTGQTDGNVYYKWPSWIPSFGVNTITLPVSNFDVSFKQYEAYDKDRLPFVLDITAFFRISDTNVAAQRVSSIAELRTQLQAIVQGAVRRVLASHDIHTVMTDRATFGKQFTSEVEEELKNWGVEPVKTIELMDMRDTANSTVIADIMAKKSSAINMESKVEVAKNKRMGDVAKIEAEQEVSLRQQQSDELIGKRTAEKDQAVGIAKQQSQQEVAREEVKTQEQVMEVRKVQTIKQAEIEREQAVVKAEQDKRTSIINAEATAESLEKEAKGRLASTELAAKGIAATGTAEAEAKKAILMAPVQAELALVEGIGGNAAYQEYLIRLESVKATVEVGKAQAVALEKAEVKIIANSGTANAGLSSIGELFSSKGGQQLGALLEGLANSDQGKKVLDVVTKQIEGPSTPSN